MSRLTDQQIEERLASRIEREREGMRSWLGIDERGQDLPQVGTLEFEHARRRAMQR